MPFPVADVAPAEAKLLGFAEALRDELLALVSGAAACGEGAAEYLGVWRPWDETAASRCVAESLAGWEPGGWVAVFRTAM